MLRHLRNIMFFFGVVSSWFLLAQVSHAQIVEDQTVEAMSAKEYSQENFAKHESIASIFGENINMIPCGKSTERCNKETEVCLKCTTTNRAGFNISVDEEGRCFPKSDDKSNYNNWCKEGYYSTPSPIAGAGSVIIRKITEEPDGFISQDETKVLGITALRETEVFESKNGSGKKYTLITDKGKVTINYAGKGFKGCEVFPVKLYNMQSCFFCPMMNILFNAVNEATKNSFGFFASSFSKVIIVVYALWLAFVSLQQVFPFTKKDASDYIELIIKQSFKFLIAYYLLVNSSFLFSTFINPVLESGLKMGEAIQSVKISPDSPRSIATPNKKTSDGFFNLKFSNGKTLESQIENYLSALQLQMAYMQSIGTSLFCVGSKHLFNLPNSENFAFGLKTLLLGGILTFFGFLFSIVFAFYFLDAILQLGLLGLMMPFMIATWPFKITSRYSKTGMDFLLNSFFIFFFTGFVISVNVNLMNESLELSNKLAVYDASSGDGKEVSKNAFNAIVMALESQNTAALKTATDIGGVGFLLLVFAALFGFKFMKEVSPLASKLASGAISGMSSDIATRGASSVTGMAKKAVSPAVKAVDRKIDKAGGTVGIMAGAVGKTADKLSNVADKVGIKPVARGLKKFGNASYKVKGAMQNLKRKMAK